MRWAGQPRARGVFGSSGQGHVPGRQLSRQARPSYTVGTGDPRAGDGPAPAPRSPHFESGCCCWCQDAECADLK